MAENSEIQWTDHTFNPWSGCEKIAPECANCYAAVNYSVLMRGVKWGPENAGGVRIVAAESMWNQPKKWNKAAAADLSHLTPVARLKHRPRVFCASLADVFEDWQGPMLNAAKKPLHHNGGSGWDDTHLYHGQVTMDDVRRRLFRLIDDTPNLDWLLLTKRPENVVKMMPDYAEELPYFDEEEAARQPNPFVIDTSLIQKRASIPGIRPNVWLGTTVGHRSRLGSIEELRCIPAAVRFLSVEPLLEDLGNLDLVGIDWVIVGGESGPKSRPCNVAWIRNVVDQCKAAGVPVFVKQLGSNPVDMELANLVPGSQTKRSGPATAEDAKMLGQIFDVIQLELRNKKGGDIAEWPEDLRIREFPKAVLALIHAHDIQNLATRCGRTPTP